MITEIYKSKTLTKHISCECESKVGGRQCNSNQCWNKDKCWFEILQHVVAKIQWLCVMKL